MTGVEKHGGEAQGEVSWIGSRRSVGVGEGMVVDEAKCTHVYVQVAKSRWHPHGHARNRAA